MLCVMAAFAWLAASQAQFAKDFDESLFKGMKCRLIGPFRGGRVLAVTGIPGNPNVFYFGAVSGGVWKTVNGGSTWEPLFDKEPVSSIGAIAVAESDPNVIYVGTGEACLRGDISYGDGVYKSLDGGKTWTNVGLKDTRQIAKVLIDPTNPNVVFVAAFGHAFGPNSERGVFRTTDGGKTWDKVLYKDDKAGAIDITFESDNPHVLYAALYQAVRRPWTFESGGPGSGLYKSTDDGTTWKQLTGHGLPDGIWGRVGVAVAGGNPDRIYALIEAKEGGLYRTDDGGEHWMRVNQDDRFRQRAWYFTHVIADPRNPDTLYILNTGLFRSTDAGKTFNLIPAPHGDHHGLWMDPTDTDRMINGNDGGATISQDGGKTWTTQYNQPTAQFYHVSTDDQFPYHVYGAQQDNTSVAVASLTGHGVIDREDWYVVGEGEAGYVTSEPHNPDVVYAGGYAGDITRFDKRTEQMQEVSPWPLDVSGYGAKDLKYRFQWTEPIFFSPHDPNTMYIAGNVLFKSTDHGDSWTIISPDLTRNDPTKQEVSGGPITKDNTSVEYYDTIFTVAESPLERGLLWAGTDDGLVQITRDNGAHWSNITPKDLPEWSLVSLIDASPTEAGKAYVAVDRHKLDDLKPYIWKTADYGKTWTKITEGIPEGSFVHVVREDAKRAGLLFAGTETGVFVSFDDGAHWQRLQLNLPTSPIHDLVVKDDDLVVATHGRAFWILDDLSPLRQFNDQIAGEAVHLYKPRLTYRLHGLAGYRSLTATGQNPPDGAIVYYYLKDKPKEKEEITLEVLDSQGKLVRKFSNIKKPTETEEPQEWPEEEKPKDLLPAEAGLNRFAWDLRYEGVRKIPGQAFGDFGPRGPYVLPGTYTLKLTAAGQTRTAEVEVQADPRVKATSADLEKQLALALQLRDLASRDHDAVIQIHDLRAQLTSLKKHLEGQASAKDLVNAADAFDKKMTKVENELYNPNIKSSEDNLNYPAGVDMQLLGLLGNVVSADAAPTKQEYGVFESLKAKADPALAGWKEIEDKDLVALNDLIRKHNVPVLMLATISHEAGKGE